MGSLWLFSVTPKVSVGMERKIDCMLSSCLKGCTKERTSPVKGWVSLKSGELSDLDTSHAIPKRVHPLAFTGSEWVTFADPVQQTGWLIHIKIISPHVATGEMHKVQKVVNSGTRLCSYILETKKKKTTLSLKKHKTNTVTC